MRSRCHPSRPLPLIGLALLLLTVPALVFAQGAVVSVRPPDLPPAAGETFTTTVAIAGGAEVLAFQFDLIFDPAVLAVESVALGPFLGSTGRNSQVLGPDQTAAADGRVVFGGFTIGQQEGASGDGVLATITWQVVGEGESQISLSGLQLAGSGGTALPADVGDPIAVSTGGAASTETPPAPAEEGDSIPYWVWFVAGAIVVVVAGLILGRRGRPQAS